MKLKLVLFDCDGVLVDSEHVAGQIASAALTELGWPLSPQECVDRFTGMSLADILPLVRARVPDVPDDWLGTLAARLQAALRANLAPVDGAIEMLHATNALGIPWRVASNSSRRELGVKFAAAGLASLVEDRYHSANDVPRPKPFPDLFLAAAAAADIAPEHCIVVEDSLPGVRAARAANMTCIGFAPYNGARLMAAGADHVVTHLSALPPLFRTYFG
jgi:HAD superfamily hydrolase (TIGR01509 family)